MGTSTFVFVPCLLTTRLFYHTFLDAMLTAASILVYIFLRSPDLFLAYKLFLFPTWLNGSFYSLIVPHPLDLLSEDDMYISLSVSAYTRCMSCISFPPLPMFRIIHRPCRHWQTHRYAVSLHSQCFFVVQFRKILLLLKPLLTTSLTFLV